MLLSIKPSIPAAVATWDIVTQVLAGRNTSFNYGTRIFVSDWLWIDYRGLLQGTEEESPDPWRLLTWPSEDHSSLQV